MFTLLGQIDQAALLEQIKNLQQPVSHSAVIAVFGLFAISIMTYLLRRQSEDKRFMIKEFVVASNRSSSALETNAKAVNDLTSAIQILREKESEMALETRDMTKILSTHPCLLLGSKYRGEIIEMINNSGKVFEDLADELHPKK